MPNEETTITLKPEGGLAFVGHQKGRILGEMTGDLLVLSRTAISDRTVLLPHFKIGKHEFCDPDYQQILLWAKTLNIDAETVIERLLAKPKAKYEKKYQTKFIKQ